MADNPCLAVHGDLVFLDGEIDPVVDVRGIGAAMAHTGLVGVALVAQRQCRGHRAGNEPALLLMIAHGGDDLHHVVHVHTRFPQDGQENHRAIGAVVVTVDGIAHVMHPARDSRQLHLPWRISQGLEDIGRRLAHIADMAGAVVGIAAGLQIAVARADEGLDILILPDVL